MKRDYLNLMDYAIYFATKAHNGQKRKTDKDVDIREIEFGTVGGETPGSFER